VQRFKPILLVLATLALVAGGLSQAQDQPTPVVGFVSDRDLQPALLTDTGANGLSRLGAIFHAYGAQTRFIELDEPIPEEVTILVLARPRRALSPAAVARLWLHLERGNHLLLALDPNAYQGVNTERSGSGIDTLLTLEYGLSLENTLLIEDWFSADSLGQLIDGWTLLQAEDIVTHPIVEPLLTYDLPVWLWGGRSLRVDAFGPDSTAAPLLYTGSAYGETSTALFRATDPNPMIPHIGRDTMRRLLIGGVGSNSATGSRVALLGDGEMLLNIYGLTRLSANSPLPRYPGNDLLTRRLAAWLLGLPEDEWPTLPDGFTRIELDGRLDDWDDSAAITPNSIFDPAPPAYNIRQVRAFYNDVFVYLLVETVATPEQNAQLTLRFIDDEEVNLRLGPGTQFQVAASLPNRTPFTAIGRNEIGDWIQVRNGRYEGWLAGFLVGLNADLDMLPVTAE
jgi:hypothetical protein